MARPPAEGHNTDVLNVLKAETDSGCSQKVCQTRETPPPQRGVVILNYGPGKGKTTAAFGLLFRAWGWEQKTMVCQFIKGARLDCGERRAARKLGIEVIAGGAGRTRGKAARQEDIESSRALWAQAREKMLSGTYALVVLDEITYPIDYGWLPVEEIIDALQKRPAHVSVVITGRNPPHPLIEIADIATEMNEIKHAYRQGIRAQRGIEF